ncbi:MAG: hypothetical protein ACMXYF_01960 [Candidatus Woesearchaeota archaeon]
MRSYIRTDTHIINVEEKSYDTNFGWTSFDGRPQSYPEYLIENDIGANLYRYSSNEESYISGIGQLNVYYASYFHRDRGSADFGYYELEENMAFSDIVQQIENWFDSSAVLENVIGNLGYVYLIEDEYGVSYFWPASESSFAYIRASKTNLDVGSLLDAYLEKHPSLLDESEVPTEPAPLDIFLELNNAVDVQTDSGVYTITLVGGNLHTEQVILDVNGQVRSIAEGDDVVIGSLRLVVEDIFTSNVPQLNAQARVRVVGVEPSDDESLVWFELSSSESVQIDGNTYFVEFLGASDYSNTVVLRINNQTKEIAQGSQYTVGGLTFFASELLIQNIPSLDAMIGLELQSGTQEVPESYINPVVLTFEHPIQTVSVGGQEWTLELKSANERSQEAHVSINGELVPFEQGERKTRGGLDIQAHKIFLYNIPTMGSKVLLDVLRDAPLEPKPDQLFLDFQTPVDVTYEGETYALEVIGGNDNRGEAYVSINGELVTFEKNAQVTGGGLNIQVNEVFLYNMPSLGAKVSLEIVGQTPSDSRSDQLFLELRKPINVTYAGDVYTLELSGGSPTTYGIVLSVNGIRRTLSQGRGATIDGLDVFVEEVFILTLGKLDAYAYISFESQEVQFGSQCPAGMQVYPDQPYLSQGCWGVCEGERPSGVITNNRVEGYYNEYDDVQEWEYVGAAQNDDAAMEPTSFLTGCQFTCGLGQTFDQQTQQCV